MQNAALCFSDCDADADWLTNADHCFSRSNYPTYSVLKFLFSFLMMLIIFHKEHITIIPPQRLHYCSSDWLTLFLSPIFCLAPLPTLLFFFPFWLITCRWFFLHFYDVFLPRTIFTCIIITKKNSIVLEINISQLSVNGSYVVFLWVPEKVYLTDESKANKVPTTKTWMSV